jgi:hypothetical protein
MLQDNPHMHTHTHRGPALGTSKASLLLRQHISKDSILVPHFFARNPLTVFYFINYEFSAFYFAKIFSCPEQLVHSVHKCEKTELKNRVGGWSRRRQTKICCKGAVEK